MSIRLGRGAGPSGGRSLSPRAALTQLLENRLSEVVSPVPLPGRPGSRPGASCPGPLSVAQAEGAPFDPLVGTAPTDVRGSTCSHFLCSWGTAVSRLLV